MTSLFPESELFLLHEIVLQLDRQAEEIVKDLGLSFGEFLVLMATNTLSQGFQGTGHDRRERDSSPSQEDVGEMLHAHKSSVSQRVSSLIQKGLMQQFPDVSNRRKVSLSLTAKGEMVSQTIYDRMEKASQKLFDGIGVERQQFRFALVELAKRVATSHEPIAFLEVPIQN